MDAFSEGEKLGFYSFGPTVILLKVGVYHPNRVQSKE